MAAWLASGLERGKRDLDALEERLVAFIQEWNESAHPFAWTTEFQMLAAAAQISTLAHRQ
jgi:hypothetical protein